MFNYKTGCYSNVQTIPNMFYSAYHMCSYILIHVYTVKEKKDDISLILQFSDGERERGEGGGGC